MVRILLLLLLEQKGAGENEGWGRAVKGIISRRRINMLLKKSNAFK